MPDNKTHIEGITKTIQALESMGKLDTKPIKSALRKNGQSIIAMAKSKCQSTHVRDAIGFITKNENQFPTTVLIGIDTKKPSGETITNVALASIMEWGSVPRYTKDMKFRGQVMARPFMRPAFDANKNAIRDNMIKSLIGIVNQQAKQNKLK